VFASTLATGRRKNKLKSSRESLKILSIS